MSYSLAFSQSLYIVLFVASKVEQKKYDFISTQLIADRLGIPPSTSSVILRRLKKAGLIEAREGVNGGVRLAKSPEQITVLDIFNAVEQSGGMFQTNVNLSIDTQLTDERSVLVQRTILDVLDHAEDQMKQCLQKVTVKNLMEGIKG